MILCLKVILLKLSTNYYNLRWDFNGNWNKKLLRNCVESSSSVDFTNRLRARLAKTVTGLAPAGPIPWFTYKKSDHKGLIFCERVEGIAFGKSLRDFLKTWLAEFVTKSAPTVRSLF